MNTYLYIQMYMYACIYTFICVCMYVDNIYFFTVTLIYFFPEVWQESPNWSSWILLLHRFLLTVGTVVFSMSLFLPLPISEQGSRKSKSSAWDSNSFWMWSQSLLQDSFLLLSYL